MSVLILPSRVDLKSVTGILHIIYIVATVVFVYVIPVEARLPLEEICYHRCKCDEILLSVNCSYANFNHVPQFHSNTRVLILDNNVLTVIDETYFEKLTSLRHLSISWSQIDDIQDDSFRSQRKVIKLDLRNNFLGEVPLALKHMKSLAELDLRWNQIGVLTNIANGARTQEPWSNVTNVKILRLDHNVLTILPVLVFSKLIKLEYLSVSYNHLLAIPEDALANLSQLEFINLSFNNLTSSYSSDLTSNKTTDISKTSGNDVSTWDDVEFSTAPTLDTDYASDNSAYGIAGFKGNYRLTRLYLQNNQIRALLSGLLDGLSNLQILHLERNVIEMIENKTFDSQLYLRELYLSENYLLFLPQTMFQPLRDLNVLKLDHNDLVDISPLTNAPLFHLTLLSLEKNNIREISEDGFTNFDALEQLYFGFNQLVTVPAIKDLSHLTILDLQMNQIREVTPLDAFTGTSLEIIHLENNALETLSMELFAHLANLQKVFLEGSKYICDCRLQWVLDYEYPNDLEWMYGSQTYGQIQTIECLEPRLYKGKSLADVRWSVENNKLRCTKYIETHMLTILLSSWGAILGFFLFIFWIYTLMDYKTRFGVRHPRKRYMAMHYADNPGANPMADETAQITFRTFESDSSGIDVVDEETTV